MLPVNVRGMWIGTFHGLCNRFLRAHWKLANLPQSFQILDTQDQLSAIKRLMKQFNVDDERFPAKQTQWFIAGCKEDGLRPRDVRGAQRGGPQEGRALPAVRGAVPARGRGRLRRADAAQLRAAARQRPDPRALPAALPPHPDRRVPGHQPAAVRLDQDVRRRAPTAAAAGNAVFAVGDDDQSIYAFRGARVGNMADFVREFDVRAPDQAGAELPQLQQHPRLGQRADQPQQDAPGQEPAHRPGPRRAGARVRGAHRLGRGAVDGRGDAPAGARRAPSRHAAAGDRGALSQQRAEPGDRDGAVQRRRAVPRVRRPALLRARRNQARAGLPAPAGEPERRHQLPARGELPAARHRRAQHRAAAGRGARRRLLAARRGERHHRQGRRQPRRPSSRRSTCCASRRRA